jgi:hypothetical protein
LTAWTSWSGANGLRSTGTGESTTNCSPYEPVTSRIGRPGVLSRSRAAIASPLMPGISTSRTAASIGVASAAVIAAMPLVAVTTS